jgi:DNA-binding response OmpR family regulator
MAGIVLHYLAGRKVPNDNLTVLVVEDSQPVTALIRSALEKDSYKVVVGHDGIEGIKLALTEQPDLVICDSVMPRMDGFALLRALKGNEATSTIPVILLTSKGTPEHEQDALSAGFFDFVSKPVHPVRISARVRRAFEMLDIG